jgi:hypothetical protein
MLSDTTEKLVDGVLHYLNEKGEYSQYSPEALSSALTAERGINRRMSAKLQTMRPIISQILFSAKSLDDTFKS